MAHRLLCQPKLLMLLAWLGLPGCYETYDLDCDEPTVSEASVSQTPTLEDLEVPVEDFLADLEEVRTAQLFAGDRQGDIPDGQPALDEPVQVQIQLEYAREGELVTPDENEICGPPYLRLPVSLTITREGETLLTATGRGPVGWYEDGFPRADMDAIFQPPLWDALGVDAPTQERPLASMFVFYRAGLAESVDIELRHCGPSRAGCPPDFAHIVWERG